MCLCTKIAAVVAAISEFSHRLADCQSFLEIMQADLQP